MLGRLLLVVLIVAATVLGVAPSIALAESPQYTALATKKINGEQVGCIDLAWAAGHGLIQPVEVRWLNALGITCPDDTVTREDVPSDQYVTMLALAAQHQLSCADIEWNAANGYLTWTGAVNLNSFLTGCSLSHYANMVTLLTSGRLNCADIDWNLNNGLISGNQASWLRAPINCEPPILPVLQQLSAAAGNWGVQLSAMAVEDLRTGVRWSLNGDQQMSFNSAAKFPWTIMATATAGVAAVEPYAGPVFINSDNEAAGAVIDLAGGIDRINSYWYPTLGMDRSCLQRWNYGVPREYSGQCGYASNPSFDPTDSQAFYNYDTPNDMTTVLGRFWRGQVPGLDAAGRARVLEWSTWSPAEWDPNGGGTITGYLPPSTWPTIHQKVGWYYDPFLTASDVGIVDLPDTTYAIALAGYGGQSSAAQADFLATASCQIYRTMSGDVPWSCAAHG